MSLCLSSGLKVRWKCGLWGIKAADKERFFSSFLIFTPQPHLNLNKKGKFKSGSVKGCLQFNSEDPDREGSQLLSCRAERCSGLCAHWWLLCYASTWGKASVPFVAFLCRHMKGQREGEEKTARATSRTCCTFFDCSVDNWKVTWKGKFAAAPPRDLQIFFFPM